MAFKVWTAPAVTPKELSRQVEWYYWPRKRVRQEGPRRMYTNYGTVPDVRGDKHGHCGGSCGNAKNCHGRKEASRIDVNKTEHTMRIAQVRKVTGGATKRRMDTTGRTHAGALVRPVTGW